MSMKSLLASALAALLLQAGGALADEPLSGFAGALVDSPSDTQVHLRAGRGTEFASLGLYFEGARVLCEPWPQGDWALVVIGNQQGYMRREYLAQPTEVWELAPTIRMGTVANPGSDRVNLRRGPGLQTQVLCQLFNGEQVVIQGETVDGWYLVQHQEQSGYMLSSMIREDAPSLFPLTEIPGSWLLCSGAGAWSTMVQLRPDGAFVGYYHDAEMGLTGAHYPDGTRYEALFSGCFSAPERLNAYEYAMTVETLTQAALPGWEQLQDGVRVITAAPFGLIRGETVHLCAPGAERWRLPAQVREAVEARDGGRHEWFLYGEESGQVFFPAG